MSILRWFGYDECKDIIDQLSSVSIEIVTTRQRGHRKSKA